MLLWTYKTFSKSFSYRYHPSGQKQSFTAPDGTVYEYGGAYPERSRRGANNELREVKIPGLGAITIAEYQWNWPTIVLYPGGGKRELEYDGLMRLKSLRATDLGGNSVLDYAYEYDSQGNIVTKQTEHGAYSYGYDGASRLTSADNPTLDDESYSYNAVGNRTSASNATGSISHNANNELLSYGEIEFLYDDNGNMIQKKLGPVAVNYVYNADNRLIRVEDDVTKTVIAEYYYDPFGRRLWKDVAGTRTYFFYSDEGLVAEYDASGNELRSYGYQPDSTWSTDPLFLKQNGSYYFYQNDHLGTPQKLVAQNGAVVWSAQYSAFGEATIDVETMTNNLRFPGQYFDAETGLHYNRFRYYDPGLGRYLRRDLIGFMGRDVNLYAYTKNNSIKIADPYGLVGKEDVAAGRTRYSCNCGWIDTTHMDDARGYLWNLIWTEGIEEFIKTGDSMVELRLNQPGIGALSIDHLTYVTGIVELQPSILEENLEEQLQVAFNIFFEFETAFERHQSRVFGGEPLKRSGFSVEDLPSDFFGFLEAVKRTFPEANGISDFSDWETLCEPLGAEESWEIYEAALMFEELFGGNITNPQLLPWKNTSHIPKLWIEENSQFERFLREVLGRCPCAEKDTTVPEVCDEWSVSPGSEHYKWLSIIEHFAGGVEVVH